MYFFVNSTSKSAVELTLFFVLHAFLSLARPAEYASIGNQQKIFLHWNQEYFVKGDTMLFKAYIMESGVPSVRSSDLFVQLLDSSGKVIERYRYPVTGGTTVGSIPLSFLQGSYGLRAFTRESICATDFGGTFIKSFYVFETQPIPAEKGKKPASSIPVVRVFPEGGRLINGLFTRMGILCTDSVGQPMRVRGKIQVDAIPIPFETNDLGMATLAFRPHINKTTVILDHHSFNVHLLPIDSEGFVLHTESEAGGKMFIVQGTKGAIARHSDLRLVVKLDTSMVYETGLNFSGVGGLKGHLLTNLLPEGLLRFMLINERDSLLAERFCFNKTYNQSKVKLSVDDKSEGEQGEYVMQLVLPDSVQGSYSLSLVDMTETLNLPRENLYNHFMFPQDEGIKREQWNQLFISEERRPEQLDSFLLFRPVLLKPVSIQGKKWEQRNFYALGMSGTVLDEKTRVAVNGGELELLWDVNDSTTQRYQLTIDKEGRFFIDSLVFFGEKKFYFSYKQVGRKKPIHILLDSANFDLVLPPAGPIDATSTLLYVGSLSGQADRLRTDTVLQPDEHPALAKIEVTARERKRMLESGAQVSTGIFSAPATVALDRTKQMPAPGSSLLDYILTNIRVLKVEEGELQNTRNRSLFTTTLATTKSISGDDSVYYKTSTGRNKGVDLFINEQFVDFSSLAPIRMVDVMAVKYWERFPSTGVPTIAVYLQSGVVPTAKKQELPFLVVKGYDTAAYTDGIFNQTFISKKGPTILWDAFITQGKKDSVKTVYFKKPVGLKKYKIVLEGFTAIGELISFEKVIED